MDYDTLSRGFNLEVKSRKYLRLLAFLLVSALLQLSVFYGLERFLQNRGNIDVEPAKAQEVRERLVTLTPAPNSPGMMAVSADHTRLAVIDLDQLRIYNLVNGQEIKNVYLGRETPGAMQWLPDRNRLLFALMNSKVTTEVIRLPVQQPPTGVKDETYSDEIYREPPEPQAIIKEGFQISLYSLDSIDDQAGPDPELIQTLWQDGPMPPKLNLNLSTYTNLLYVNWLQDKQDNLVQIDIMRRIKDIRLPRGQLARLVVTPRNGSLWVETIDDNGASIYKYQKNRWKLQKFLDGYRLLGVTPDDLLAVAPDQGGQVREVFLVNEKGDFKPGWAFSTPLRLKDVSILKDGRLLYFDQQRVIIHTPQLGKGTVFNLQKVDAYSPDGKLMVSWQQDYGQVKIVEEVKE